MRTLESKETQIARVCHEANRAYALSLGDKSHLRWDDTSAELRYSAVQGVNFRLANPDATPESQHQSWYDQKYAEGWRYGAVKDPAAKTHPSMLPYDELPETEKKKDILFSAIVNALK